MAMPGPGWRRIYWAGGWVGSGWSWGGFWTWDALGPQWPFGFGLGLTVIMVEGCYLVWEGASVSSFLRWGPLRLRFSPLRTGTSTPLCCAQDRHFDSALLCSGQALRLRFAVLRTGTSTPLCCAQDRHFDSALLCSGQALRLRFSPLMMRGWKGLRGVGLSPVGKVRVSVRGGGEMVIGGLVDGADVWSF